MSGNKGLAAARYLRSLAVVGKSGSNEETRARAALAFAEGQDWRSTPEVAGVLRAAVDAMGIGNAGALASQMGIDLMGLIRPRTLVGRLANLRRMPFNITAVTQTGGTKATWIHEAYPKPVQASSFVRGSALVPMKVGAISVHTQELMRTSNSEDIILQDLSDAAVQAMDMAFIDPDSGPLASERPGSVTYGAPTAASGGHDYAALRADVRKLVQLFPGNLDTATLVTDPRTAVDIALMAAPFGGASFDLAAGTGNLFGLPVLLSGSSPNDSNGAILSLVDPANIEIAGGDGAELRISTEAAIQMSSSPSSGAASMVSLWQTNCVGLLAEVFVNWQARTGGAASVITGVSYTGA